MHIKNKIKISIMKKNILKKKAAKGFDVQAAENFKLPDGCEVNYNNSYYFSAHNLLGESLYVRLGQRGDGNDEIWFVYHSADFTLVSAQNIYAREYSPLSINLLSSGEKVAFAFNGKVRKAELVKGEYKASGEQFDCELDAEFTATAPIFDFFYHMNELALAKAFAREKWTKQFFEGVQQNDQTHYEQQGTLTAEISFNGEKKSMNSPCIRDHSFGKRDWSFMNNHRWLLCLLEDGRAINISMVSYPTYRKLEVGNTMLGGKCVCLMEQNSADDLVCGGNIPSSFKINAKLENGEQLAIEVKKEFENVYIMGDGYTLREGVGEFLVNGERARGIIEFGFNSDSARWFRG